MNTRYLMEYISYHLHTFVRAFSIDKELRHSFCARIDFQDPLWELPEMKSFLFDMENNRIPLLTAINDELIYAAVSTPKQLFLIGPVRFDMFVKMNHQISGIPVDSSWKKEIYVCQFHDFIRDTLLLHNLFQMNTLDMDKLIALNCIDAKINDYIEKNLSELLFENQEYGKKHNPYDQEFRECISIENGDIEQLEKSWAEDYTGQLGTLAKNKLRNMKNICIVVITLASRAAIRGGLNPEISFSLSDIYIMKIEETNDIAKLTHLKNSAEYKYTMLVKEIKEQQIKTRNSIKNPNIDKCKDYIFTHLHEKIYVGDIAQHLKVNSKYLSDLFKQWEGITITDYILHEKINLAKNLLIYSSYQFIEIATYLGFSSQSHFGKQFKKVTKMTPKQYRITFGVKEFS